MKIFESRTTAGAELASLLGAYKKGDGIVLALPRGGVPVALEIAKFLTWPLDVFVARKIGAPFDPEFGIGAIAEGGIIVWDKNSIDVIAARKEELEGLVVASELEIQRRVDAYRGSRRPPQVKDKVVILADDGLATGITALAAIRSLKLQNPKKIVLAVPVCPSDTMKKLKDEADEIMCVHAPFNLVAIGLWYRDFKQLTDEDVVKILDQSRMKI